MKSNGRLLLTLMMSFLMSLDVTAQQPNLSDTIKQDSLLFYQNQLNLQRRPLLPLDVGIACDDFLKERDAHYENYGKNKNHRFIGDGWTEMDEFRLNSSTIPSGDSYEMRMQDKWAYYVKMLRTVYKNKLDSIVDEEAEKKNLIARIEDFGNKSTYKPLFYKIISEEYHGSVRGYIDKLYATSMMCNKKVLRRFLRRPSRRRLNADMGAQMSIAIKMYQIWLVNHGRIPEEKEGLFVYKP